MAERTSRPTIGARYGSIIVVAAAQDGRWLIRCDCGVEELRGHRFYPGVGRCHRCTALAHRGAPRTRADLIAKAMASIVTGAPDDCWLFKGNKNAQGYGMVAVQKLQDRAHRLSYEHHVGPIPAGMFVCHHCDNPPCCNPAHLFLGTVQDNNADRDAKGRNVTKRGEENARAILSAADVVEIRASSSNSFVLGEVYGVHHSTVRAIKARRNWRHVA